MKIAVVGSGISGMVCARVLNDKHDVTLFEANDYPGGHTHTVPCAVDGRTIHVDTGNLPSQFHPIPFPEEQRNRNEFFRRLHLAFGPGSICGKRLSASPYCRLA